MAALHPGNTSQLGPLGPVLNLLFSRQVVIDLYAILVSIRMYFCAFEGKYEDVTTMPPQAP
jgi:hypothetical protein